MVLLQSDARMSSIYIANASVRMAATARRPGLARLSYRALDGMCTSRPSRLHQRARPRAAQGATPRHRRERRSGDAGLLAGQDLFVALVYTLAFDGLKDVERVEREEMVHLAADAHFEQGSDVEG